MFRFSATTRIVMVQVSLAMTILMIGLSLGIVPDHRPHLLEGRARLCEALAAEALSAPSGDQQELQSLFARRTSVDRGTLRAIYTRPRCGGKTARWKSKSVTIRRAGLKIVAEAASDAFIEVPIFSGGRRDLGQSAVAI